MFKSKINPMERKLKKKKKKRKEFFLAAVKIFRFHLRSTLVRRVCRHHFHLASPRIRGPIHAPRSTKHHRNDERKSSNSLVTLASYGTRSTHIFDSSRSSIPLWRKSISAHRTSLLLVARDLGSRRRRRRTSPRSPSSSRTRSTILRKCRPDAARARLLCPLARR